MIRLKKGPKPQVLGERAELWTREYLDALASGDKEKIRTKRKRYNHSQIKEALISETKAKMCVLRVECHCSGTWGH